MSILDTAMEDGAATKVISVRDYKKLDLAKDIVGTNEKPSFTRSINIKNNGVIGVTELANWTLGVDRVEDPNGGAPFQATHGFSLEWTANNPAPRVKVLMEKKISVKEEDKSISDKFVDAFVPVNPDTVRSDQALMRVMGQGLG